jgi:hypothetical protein
MSKVYRIAIQALMIGVPFVFGVLETAGYGHP